MDESLIISWVNPTRGIIDNDCRPILTYVEPPSDGYWYIPISPNSKYFPVLEPFDLNLPDNQRLPLEFEGLNLFHAKHGTDFEKIWSKDRLLGVKNYNVRKFMKSKFFSIPLLGEEMIISGCGLIFPAKTLMKCS